MKENQKNDALAVSPVKEKPLYTKGEEIFNAVSHIVGGAIGIAILVLGIVFAALNKDAFAVVSMVIYGVSMIMVYAMSSIYHFLRPNSAKRIFRIFDHCAIFLLIAGTYTPVCLISLRTSGAWGWGLFGALWFLAAVGITLNAANMKNKAVKAYSYTAYLLMGWSALFVVVPLLRVLEIAGFLWILAGGIAYSGGMIFYGFGKKKKYIHSVWHLFVVAGSVLQFIGILFYIVL